MPAEMKKLTKLLARQSHNQKRNEGLTAEAQDVRKNPWQLTAVVYIGA
jgi:hypothetical protein